MQSFDGLEPIYSSKSASNLKRSPSGSYQMHELLRSFTKDYRTKIVQTGHILMVQLPVEVRNGEGMGAIHNKGSRDSVNQYSKPKDLDAEYLIQKALDVDKRRRKMRIFTD